ncbi:toxin-activating lysine-acyltransferase [Roseovarius sp. SYSU LYC5161]|uniref:toxin-activating lysine-acyltransferase n=1 Tax=Roseovarius halophilus (ex Wu et al. 2025) TaxID=3376060 RepID=UPI00399998D6
MTALTDASGRPLPDIEVPGPERLRIYGDMAFLAFRSPRHARMPVSQLRAYLEPPLLLGQFRVFRFDGIARGLYTWGWLGQEAERRLVTGGQLTPEDWTSGDRLWIVDIMAPYKGMTRSMVRWIMEKGHFTDTDFFFRRVGDDDRTRRIVHIDFRRRDLAKVYSEADFLKATD